MLFASSFCLKLPYPIPKYPPTTGFRQGSDINFKKLRNHVISKSNMACDFMICLSFDKIFASDLYCFENVAMHQ